jgi:hypothetical protein
MYMSQRSIGRELNIDIGVLRGVGGLPDWSNRRGLRARGKTREGATERGPDVQRYERVDRPYISGLVPLQL